MTFTQLSHTTPANEQHYSKTLRDQARYGNVLHFTGSANFSIFYSLT